MTIDLSYERDKRGYDFEVWAVWENDETVWSGERGEVAARRAALEALDVTDCDYVEIRNRLGVAIVRRGGIMIDIEIVEFTINHGGGRKEASDTHADSGFVARQSCIPGTLDVPPVLVLEPQKGGCDVHRPEYRKQFEMEV